MRQQVDQSGIGWEGMKNVRENVTVAQHEQNTRRSHSVYFFQNMQKNRSENSSMGGVQMWKDQIYV